MSDPNPTHSALHDPVTLSNAGPTATGADPNVTQDEIGERTFDAASPVSAGRYELGEAIARGGMGVVYRAIDTAFAREVAVKVLQHKYGVRSDAARRFADEARITGQLQHPAIPPVHDLGMLPDDRPFLAMKLIKGETLDDLLKARSDPSADRGRFVAAFEQVCQAVAYAHAHNVIHRDLKPANVMVGAFGEVQVMDWGLAKVLGSRAADATDPDETVSGTAIHSMRESDSAFTQAGSVLGTPAYMPPEQAIGAINKVDARSDVFGLGAILAVILTGKPPFMASSVETTRLQAAQGNLEECFARLDASGAEPELVLLCKRCLSKKPGDRPADAGEVAKAVAELRAAADERARQAELDRVKAEGDKVAAELRVEGERQRTEEQRKRRRVQLALAGFAVLVAIGAGIATAVVQQDRADKQREADRLSAEKQRAEDKLSAETKRQSDLRQVRADALVDALSTAETVAVPRVVHDLTEYRDLTGAKLVEMRANANPGSKEQLHASLALLPVDRGQVAYLYGRLLDAEPHQVPVVRDALAPYKGALLDKLWAVAISPENDKERLRAASALATYDPESERWAKASGPVVEQLVGENPVFLGLWMESFRPIKGKLSPSLAIIYRDANRRESERTLAMNILADYVADQPPVLSDLLMDADEKQFAVIYPKFKGLGDKVLPLLDGEIDKTLPPGLPAADDQREKLAKRQANAAVALLRLNQPVKVWPLLKHSHDPRARSYLIHRLSPLGADPIAFVKRLDEETDITIRRALLLSLGEFKETDFTPDERKSMLPRVQEMYRTASDPGLHAAAEWLLRQWKQEAWLTQVNGEWEKDGEGRDKRMAGIKELVTKDKDKTPPQWYVNNQGQTMVVIPGPVEFVMGTPTTEAYRRRDEIPHKERIGRTFALAATPVTKDQFLRFRPKFSHNEMKRYPEPTCPIGGVVWTEAAAYCNWLCKEEGIPEDQWCYEINGNVTKLKEKYLSLSGYRLPTEAEMEYATRAGALTSRYYGETEELLAKYAWYEKNSLEKTWPVGSLKPNDLGLFDVLGNVYAWCQEKYKPYPQGDEVSDDKEDDLAIMSTDSRVLRGGSFFNQASIVRCANRNVNLPTFRLNSYSLRPARTFIP